MFSTSPSWSPRGRDGETELMARSCGMVVLGRVFRLWLLLAAAAAFARRPAIDAKNQSLLTHDLAASRLDVFSRGSAPQVINLYQTVFNEWLIRPRSQTIMRGNSNALRLTPLMAVSALGLDLHLDRLMASSEALRPALDARDSLLGWTALMHAASRGQLKCVRRLLVFTADPGLPDDDGRSAADLALIRGHAEVSFAIRDWQASARTTRRPPVAVAADVGGRSSATALPTSPVGNAAVVGSGAASSGAGHVGSGSQRSRRGGGRSSTSDVPNGSQGARKPDDGRVTPGAWQLLALLVFIGAVWALSVLARTRSGGSGRVATANRAKRAAAKRQNATTIATAANQRAVHRRLARAGEERVGLPRPRRRRPRSHRPRLQLPSRPPAPRRARGAQGGMGGRQRASHLFARQVVARAAAAAAAAERARARRRRHGGPGRRHSPWLVACPAHP